MNSHLLYLIAVVTVIGCVNCFNSFHLYSKRKSYHLSMSSTTRSSKFAKYHGLGNDFIIVDNTKSNEPIYTPEEAVKWCDRNFGIGGDGLIFVMPGINKCDYTMRIYNSDGSEPQMCGNGIRCMAKYIQTLENKDQTEVKYKIWTNAGVIVPEISGDGSITVDMGEPILDAKIVPSLLSPTDGVMAIDSDIEVLGKVYKTTAISMGNPHAITFVADLEKMDPSFETVGPLFEKHEMFPEKVNAEFVEVLSPTHLKMKVWERGAGPTLACGTGACALLVAAVLTGRAERHCKVTLPGGDLQIRWDEIDNKIYMTGPAKLAFEGVASI